MSTPAHTVLELGVAREQDVVAARQWARDVASLLGFESQDQTRIATSVSEIARNAFAYAQNGRIEFNVQGTAAPQALVVRIQDDGPGIANLAAILAGQYRSMTGMGQGILGAQRLMDDFEIRSEAGRGTEVRMKKYLPHGARILSAAMLEEVRAKLAERAAVDPIRELQQQNRELLRTLGELRDRQQDLVRLNQTLEETIAARSLIEAERERLLRSEQVARGEAEKANRLKDDFLAMLSHELRTPMSVISNWLQLLQDGDRTPEQSDRGLKAIGRAVSSQSQLIEDLLDVSRIVAGRLSVERKPVALRGILEAALENLALSAGSKRVLSSPDLAYADCLVLADGARMQQVFSNLLHNAVKFTEEGGCIEIRVFSDAKTATVRIRDTGEGISAEFLPHVFDRFRQAHEAPARRHGGLGLGLAIVRHLVELHEGSVHAESPGLGQGATFVVTLPRLQR